MAINALIAQGIRPIGADVPDIANMLAQRQQQAQQNALAQQRMALDQQNAEAFQRQVGLQADQREAQLTQQQYEYAARAGLALSQAKTPQEFDAIKAQVLADPQYQSIPGAFTAEQMTPENVRATLPAVLAKAGMQAPKVPGAITLGRQGGFSYLQQDGAVIPGSVDKPQAPTPAPKEVNKQLVTRPTPDGRQQDYSFNPQTSQLEPVGQPYEKAAPLSPKDTNVAKQKLTQIGIAKRQLANAKAKFEAIKGSFSAGPGGSLLPSPAGKAFDAAIDGMRGSITSLTRVPGVGAMSDYETRLDQAKFPTRGDYEDVIGQKLDQLGALIDGLDTGYRDLLGGPSDTAAPAETGAPKPGMVQDGYRFKGGDPAKPESWEKVGK